MNFIESGLSWFQKQRHAYTSSDVFIGFTESERVLLKATVTGSNTQSSMDQVTVQSQHWRFVFRRCDLVNNSIKIQRGLKIWFKDNEFTVAFDGKLLHSYNDPQLLDVTFRATLSKEANGITPGSIS